MNFDTFLSNLETLEKSISIVLVEGEEGEEDTTLDVQRVFWGAPPDAISDLPCFVNALTEGERVLGFGSRDQRLQVNVQLFVKRARIEDTESARNATAFWYAAKDAFDRDTTIGDSVPFSTLRGATPTVPVILSHAGQAYIGFNAVLDIHDVEEFSFEAVE